MNQKQFTVINCRTKSGTYFKKVQLADQQKEEISVVQKTEEQPTTATAENYTFLTGLIQKAE